MCGSVARFSVTMGVVVGEVVFWGKSTGTASTTGTTGTTGTSCTTGATGTRTRFFYSQTVQSLLDGSF